MIQVLQYLNLVAEYAEVIESILDDSLHCISLIYQQSDVSLGISVNHVGVIKIARSVNWEIFRQFAMTLKV